MNDNAADLSYLIAKDDKGRLRSVSRRSSDDDTTAVPINGTSREYCEFLTWACNQKIPVASGLERLEPQSIYFADTTDLVSYCKREGTVLSTRLTPDGQRDLVSSLDEAPAEGPISIYHSEQIDARWHGQTGRLLLYRLYQAKGIATAHLYSPVDELPASRLPVFVTADLHSRLIEMLKDEDSDIRRLSSWSVERTFVYVDVSEFSKYSPAYQLDVINSLVQITNSDRWWPRHWGAGSARADREASLCIGDGYIFVFRNSWMGAYFASHLAALIERLIAIGELAEFHFRIGVHTGSVYRFWDRWGSGIEDGRWNYIGRGITDGQRVLSAIGKDMDDVVFVSADTRQRILARYGQGDQFDIGPWLQNRGRRSDKHGELRRVYEVNHTGWMGEACEPIVDTPVETKE